jgi:hypothetical protein
VQPVEGDGWLVAGESGIGTRKPGGRS